jgi:fatty-acyl-CoA synthase
MQKGDVTALYMENRPEYLWHYLAAAKLGVVVALVNPHARGDGLVHALVACGADHLIAGSERWSQVLEVRDRLPTALAARVYVDQDPGGEEVREAAQFARQVASSSTSNPAHADQPQLGDLGAYMYTSGTTGMPKAARVTYGRLTNVGYVLGALAWRLGPRDIIYNCLPLCHSNGLLLATSSVIAHGATLALARQFSVKQFWDDICRYEATGFNYLGEMCRYLTNAPPSSLDGAHRLRIMVGQGLRTDIWSAFQRRFKVRRVVEFYGSTEGNFATMNLTGSVGSVGKLTFGAVLARWDDRAQDFLRDAKGHLVESRCGEPGVLLGPIRKRTPFDGYRDEQATNEKIVRSAFRNGDAWYNTGDLFRFDARRNLFFLDRLGDTFRWKGQNVATLDVQEQLAKWHPIAMANVYGVEVNGTEGRAGMASLVLHDEEDFDPLGFARHVDAALPPYARPVFVRIHTSLETTATLKLTKARLQRDGFDATRCSDRLYFRRAGGESYERLTADLYREVVSGTTRL